MNISKSYTIEFSEEEYDVLERLLGKLSLQTVLDLNLSINDDDILRSLYDKFLDVKPC